MSQVLKLRYADLPINWHQLHQLSDGNEEFELELLKIFFVETDNRLQLASRAIASQDCQTLQYLAHQIKGASGNLGFQDMWNAAASLEQQARQAELSQGTHLLERLMTSLARVKHFLEATN
ncbi:MAG: Hpt domain-containing protein [Synechococcales bacterium]|nr:Hpt domain-containing protein [Synechococcales bacterium]